MGTRIIRQANPQWQKVIKKIARIDHCSVIPGTDKKICSVQVEDAEKKTLGLGFITLSKNADEKSIVNKLGIVQCDPTETVCNIPDEYLAKNLVENLK